MLDSPMSRSAGSERTAGTTTPFFVAAFAITWLSQLPAVLAQRGVIPGTVESYLPLIGLGMFGPLLAAVIAASLESGREGRRALFRQLRFSTRSTGWYLGALAFPGGVLAIGMAIFGLLGGDGSWFYPPKAAPAMVALFVGPLAEEIGWRGFAYPRLLERHGALKASVILGLLWGPWHLMMFLLVKLEPSTLAIMIPYFVAGSVIFTWFYHRSGSGLPVLIFAHAGSHLSNSHQTLPANIAPLVVQLIGFSIVAVLLVTLDREAFRLHRTARG
jgi:uncharacterized protein